MSHVVASLEGMFLHHLEALKNSLSAKYPRYKFNTYSSSVGGLTEYQGHDVGIECIFPDAADHESDCVALVIGVKHLTTSPLLCEASVCWGAGASPDVQGEVIATPIPYSENALHDASARLPELVATFESAISVWNAQHADT